MGAWGTGILQDDSAMDIIDDYRILLGYKVPNDEAYRLIKEYYYPDFNGSDDEDIFWFALAIYQVRNGILMDEVKKKAFEFLENPSSLDVWKESGENIYQNRLKVLAKLKEELQNPTVKEPKKIPKSPTYMRARTKFKEGDLIAVNMGNIELYETYNKKNKHYAEKYCLIRVLRIEKDPITKLMPELDYSERAVIGVYKWLGSEIPNKNISDDIEFMDTYGKSGLGLGEDKELYQNIYFIRNDSDFPGKEYFSYECGSFSGYVAMVLRHANQIEKLRKQGEKFEALGD